MGGQAASGGGMNLDPSTAWNNLTSGFKSAVTSPGALTGGSNQPISNPANGSNLNPVPTAAGVPSNPAGTGSAQPAGGMPTFPGLQAGVDPNGKLIPGATTTASPASINYGAADDPSMANMSTYANAAGPSPWLQLQNQNVASQVAGMKGANAVSQESGVQQASDAAASHGGLTGGGAARIGAASLMGKAGADQSANNSGFLTNNNNAVTDMQTKLATQQQVVNDENQTATVGNSGNEYNAGLNTGVSGQNASNTLTGINQANTNSVAKYGQDMNGYIGNQLATALGKTGKSKG